MSRTFIKHPEMLNEYYWLIRISCSWDGSKTFERFLGDKQRNRGQRCTDCSFIHVMRIVLPEKSTNFLKTMCSISLGILNIFFGILSMKFVCSFLQKKWPLLKGKRTLWFIWWYYIFFLMFLVMWSFKTVPVS